MDVLGEVIRWNGVCVPGFEPTAAPCPRCPLPWPFLAAQQLAWVRTNSIKPGDRVRLSIGATGLTALSAAVKQLGFNDFDLNTLITNAKLAAVWPLQGTAVKVWTPDDVLPADWPKDDVNTGSEFHAELTYSGTAPLDSTNVALTWVGKGMGGGACASDADCPSGQACVGGKCVQQQPAEQKGMSTAAVAGIAVAAVIAGGLVVWMVR